MAQPGVGSKDLQVLVKLLGMLGTDNPHERAAFAAKAHAWVTQRGLDWSALLIPEEPPELPLGSPFSRQSGVGGGTQRPYAEYTGNAGTASSASQGAAQGQSWGHTTFPAWKPLAERMLKDHPNLLKGTKENQFLADQIARALQYGTAVRISEKQQAWLRDILGRAGLTW